MRRSLAYLTVVLLACLAFSSSAAASTANTFKTVCNIGNTNKGPSPQRMDPIKFPGQYPVGHSHEFGGQYNIGPSQTGSAIQHAGIGTLPDGSTGPIHTSCRDRFDTAAYWFPTLYVDSGFGWMRVTPTIFDAYYEAPPGEKTSAGVPFTAMEVPPTDMRIIAGNGDATGPQPINVVKWHCLGRDAPNVGNAPPMCPNVGDTGVLAMSVTFPNCWDGNLANHLANGMNDVQYYSGPPNAQCPTGHDHAVSRILLSIHYGNTTLPDCTRTDLYTPPAQLGVNCVNYGLATTDTSGNPIVGKIWTGHADVLIGWALRDTSGYDNPPDGLADLVERFNIYNGASCDEACTETKDANGNLLPGDAFTGG